MTMAEREQKRRAVPAREEEKIEEEAPASTERADKIKAELDDLLDEIDEVLDENAEEFVRSYVQKGGQ
jgi:ubiquitin-like protein Pup